MADVVQLAILIIVLPPSYKLVILSYTSKRYGSVFIVVLSKALPKAVYPSAFRL